MNTKYYMAIRPQSNDYHSVHKEECPFLPPLNERIYLGEFISAEDAMFNGMQHFHKTGCCRFCMKEDKAIEKFNIFSGLNLSAILPTEKQLADSLLGSLLGVLN